MGFRLEELLIEIFVDMLHQVDSGNGGRKSIGNLIGTCLCDFECSLGTRQTWLECSDSSGEECTEFNDLIALG